VELEALLFNIRNGEAIWCPHMIGRRGHMDFLASGLGRPRKGKTVRQEKICLVEHVQDPPWRPVSGFGGERVGFGISV